MSGFVLMHREVLEHPLFAKDAQRLGAWLWMVGRACWKPTKFNVQGKTVELARGQFCCTVRELGEAWGMSKSAVDRFLTRLRTETMIGTDSGTGRLIITICNYSKYQDVGNEGGTAIGTLGGTAAGQQRDIKEQGNKGTREEEPNGSPSSASAQENDDKRSDDLFADAPAKAKTKGKRTPAAEKTLPEDWEPNLTPRAQAIVDGWPPGMLDKEEFKFRNWHQSRGSKMKDWDAAFRTWIGNADDRNGYKIPSTGFGAPAGSRFQPEGGIAEGLRRIESARNNGSSREVGQWEDSGTEAGYRRSHS